MKITEAAEKEKRRYNARRTGRLPVVGEFVYLRSGTQKGHLTKLEARCTGPYRVTQVSEPNHVYIVDYDRDDEEPEKVHVDRLRYQPTPTIPVLPSPSTHTGFEDDFWTERDEAEEDLGGEENSKEDEKVRLSDSSNGNNITWGDIIDDDDTEDYHENHSLGLGSIISTKTPKSNAKIGRAHV